MLNKPKLVILWGNVYEYFKIQWYGYVCCAVIV